MFCITVSPASGAFKQHLVRIYFRALQFHFTAFQIEFRGAYECFLTSHHIRHFRQELFVMRLGRVARQLQALGVHHTQHRDGLHVEFGFIQIRFCNRDGLLMRFEGHRQFRLQLIDGVACLRQRSAVVVEAKQHELPVEFGYYLILFRVRARRDHVLQNQHVVVATTAATAAAIARSVSAARKL